MKNALLILTIFTIICISQRSKAQSAIGIAVSDTTVHDDRTTSGDHQMSLPQMSMSLLEYNSFINKELSASKILKNNRIYTKVEIARIIEKDGTVSAYTVTGTGPEEVKAELVRIAKLMPKYKPGGWDGKPARFRLYQPFEFKYN